MVTAAGAISIRARPRAAALVAAGLLLVVTGCASIPGKTAEEQAITMEELERTTLEDIRRQEPATEAEIDTCVGYVIMNNKLTKIPLVGVGAGYGVAVRRATNERTYLRMRRFDIGAGWGARSVRPVLIFRDEGKFLDYVDGGFAARIGAEAAAKVGDTGAAGGGGDAAGGEDPGYSSYLITDAGVSATASLAVMRVKPIEIKK